MANINKNIIMQAGAAVANATNKAAGLSASTPEPGSIISAIQLVNGGRTIGPSALAHFTESVRNKLLSLLVNMEPTQSGSGTPSPDNVRPFSGRTGLTIYASPTPYAADATTYSEDWTSEAGTVYSGTLDVVTGVLTVDSAITEFDGSSDETWYWQNSGFAFGAVSGGIITDATTQLDELTLCDKLQPSSWVDRSAKDNSCGMYYGASFVFIKNTNSITSVATARTWLAANPITVMYPLATPLTYQLTAQDIITLVGYNYIWSDSGDVTITE